MTNEQKAQAWFEEFRPDGQTVFDAQIIAFAAFCLDKRDILPEVEGEQWQTLNHRLLVNFLFLPEEHQVHLLESMFVKRPNLKELLNALK
jgi:hypothetical protein